MRKAIIILPTYNEAGNIEALINEIFEVTKGQSKWQIEILVNDSSSTDKTGEIVKKLQENNPAIHLMTTKKEGLGKAYVQGFQYAIDHLQPYLLFEMDADHSHDPHKIPEFLAEIENGADMVVGSRYMKGGSIPDDWGLHRKLFSFFGNLIVRFGFMKLKYTDWTGGYRALKMWLVKDSMNHVKHYSGYVFQIALLDFAIKNNARIAQVPFNFRERKYGRSKINAVQYIIHIILYILRHSPFVKFVIVGGIGFILDFAVSYFLIERAHAAVWAATLLSTEMAIISNFVMNNYWSFAHKKLENTRSTYIWSFLKFNLVSSGSILIQTTGMQILSNMFGREMWFVYKFFIILFIVIPYSYILYNKFIWKEKK